MNCITLNNEINDKNWGISIFLQIISLIILLIIINTSLFIKKENFNQDMILHFSNLIYHKYNIKISIKFSRITDNFMGDPIDAIRATPLEIECVLKLIADEFSLYDDNFIKKYLFKKIVICKNLTQSNSEKGAISDFSHDILYISTNDILEIPKSKEKDLHHEIFHMIDFYNNKTFEDDTWVLLNVPTFRYGPSTGRELSNIRGFLNGYSMNDPAEDKAELFSLLINEYDVVFDRAASDDVISKKIKILEKMLLQYDTNMNGSFWEKVRHRNRKSSQNETK